MRQMNMDSRNQYLTTLRDDYLNAAKKEKGVLLDEYVRNTEHNRKYVIYKLNHPQLLMPRPGFKRKRKVKYGQEINPPLVKLWEIFDYPCGQRLKPLIEAELERLRKFRELSISDKISEMLKTMSSATIDRRLKHQREYLGQRRFSTTKPGFLLKTKIPVRLTNWDTSKIGYVETDLVAHCGDNVFGTYVNTVSVTEIATGWWEGEAIMGKGERPTLEALKLIRARCPFDWKGLDSDNGGEFINHMLWKYCQNEEVDFTRSRENKKNDNAYVEQKNWTHVRKVFGYLRYDTPQEVSRINDLYHNELRLYKNFFQTGIKLAKKERIGGKRKRKYEKKAKTPYQRIIESDQIHQKNKDRLLAAYKLLNPAELKRRIDRELQLLCQANLLKYGKSVKFALKGR